MKSIFIDKIEYFAAADLLKELNITRQTLWRWRQNSLIPSGRLFRNHQLIFTLQEVEEIEFFANRLVPSPTQPVGQLTLFKKV